MIRLGFHYHVPAYKKNGCIYTHGAQAVFLDSLSPFCNKIICFLHTPRETEKYLCNYEIKSSNIEFIDIGLHRSVPYRSIFSNTYSAYIDRRRYDIDVLLLRGPSPMLAAMAKKILPVPSCLLLVGGYRDGIDSLPQPPWRKKLIRIWASWNESQQLAVAKKNLTFVNSHKLYSELYSSIPKLIETRTTTVSSNDIRKREDTCQAPPYHILFSGRITAEKGVADILQAVSILRREGIDCFLDLVGVPEPDNYLEEVKNTAVSLGIEDKFKYHGYKTVGDELLAYYFKADIFIIASRSSFEGFPRTIWEAFSQCTPVVATGVGSIPFFLKHEHDALISEPNSPKMLAAFLKRIILEPELRKQLITNGMNLAMQNTLEFRAKEMMGHINDWIFQKRSLKKPE